MIWTLFQKVKLPLMLLCPLMITLIVLIFYHIKSFREVDDLRHKLSSLNSQALHIQEIRKMVKLHQQAFDHFEACEFHRPLTNEDLTYRYPYQIDFRAQSIQDNTRQHNTKLTVQDVTFFTPCQKDNDIYNLVNQLLKTGPGIFQIQEITINRVSALSEEMLQRVALGKPQVLFQGKVKARWIHQ